MLSNVRGFSTGFHAASATWWQSQEPRTLEGSSALLAGFRVRTPRAHAPLTPGGQQKMRVMRRSFTLHGQQCSVTLQSMLCPTKKN